MLTPPAIFYAETTKPELEEKTNRGLLKYVLELEKHMQRLTVDRQKIKEWVSKVQEENKMGQDSIK